MGSPRPGLPPIPRRRPRTQATGLRARGTPSGPPPSPALGRRVHPAGCRGPQSISPRPFVRLGAPKRSSASGRGRRARSRRDRGIGAQEGPGPGRGVFTVQLRAPPPPIRAARAPALLFPAAARAARAPGPPSPARATLGRLRGWWRAGAKVRARPGVAGPAPPLRPRCRALYSVAVGDPASLRPGFARFPGARRLARPRLPRGGGGVHRHLPLRSGNSGPGAGGRGVRGQDRAERVRARDADAGGRGDFV